MLEHAGFNVVVATSGEEGVDVATRGGLDLVLMDLQLPGIDGTEAMRRIRADPGVETAGRRGHRLRHARGPRAGPAAGFDGYIEKPISTRAVARDGPSTMSGGPAMAEQVTVLAVDDQPANLRLLEAVLTPRGYDVRTATSGAEASASSPTGTSTWCCSTS